MELTVSVSPFSQDACPFLDRTPKQCSLASPAPPAREAFDLILKIGRWRSLLGTDLRGWELCGFPPPLCESLPYVGCCSDSLG